jgi:bifunctional non-homologous end joining protein LigD
VRYARVSKAPGKRFSEPVYPRPALPPREAIADYYRLVGPLMLPFLARRPLNLFRCSGERCFFQRNRDHPPTGEGFFREPIRQFPIAQKNGRTEAYLYVEDVEGMIACAEAKAVELHAWGCRIDAVERPDRVVIDLDPGEGVDFGAVREGALQVRQSLEAVGLESWALLTGGKGVHVVVPIRPEAEWDTVRNFARTFCTALAGLLPDRFTVALPKPQRRGRIFLDYLRNQRTATAIMPWSLRAREGAPIAVPSTWQEVEKAESAVAMTFEDLAHLPKRAGKLRGWGSSDQSLPGL